MFMILSYYVNDIEPPSGHLVEGLTISKNGVDDVQVGVHFTCECYRLNLELPLYLLFGV